MKNNKNPKSEGRKAPPPANQLPQIVGSWKLPENTSSWGDGEEGTITLRGGKSINQNI